MPKLNLQVVVEYSHAPGIAHDDQVAEVEYALGEALARGGPCAQGDKVSLTSVIVEKWVEVDMLRGRIMGED